MTSKETTMKTERDVNIVNGTGKRGEGKARRMLAALADAGVNVRFERKDGEWGVAFPDYRQLTPEQKEVAQDVVLFGIAYPRCFATMARLHREAAA